MKPLVDGDILVYEAACCAEAAWQSGGVAPFDYVEGLIEGSVLAICEAVKATEPPLIFLSTDNNFRYQIAKTKPYKGNRKHDSRPFHYDNIRAYIPARWDCVVCDGYEADDGLAMYQTHSLEVDEQTIICTRDKDLRQVPGLHYTWSRGGQDEWGPSYIDNFGSISLDVRDVIPTDPAKKPYKKYKCRGFGLMFFYAQCIMGDTVDNIPGLKGSSDLKAYEILNGATSEYECHTRVLDAYKTIYGDKAEEIYLEQAQLLWMVRRFNDNGELEMFKFPRE